MLIGVLHHDFVQQSIQVVPLLAIRAGYIKNFGHVIESPYLSRLHGRFNRLNLNPFVVYQASRSRCLPNISAGR